MKPNMIYIDQAKHTPLGTIWIAGSDQGLLIVNFSDSQAEFTSVLTKLGFKEIIQNHKKTATFIQQITDYLAAERREFDLPIDWSLMSPFQGKALRATCDIPYGGVSTYGAIARQIGRPHAARAVGRAEATNPMPLVIPCHRVLGSDGSLHGYSGRGGLHTKAWLLQLEGVTNFRI
jgi:methylated-DNA-[protein]-cysteine S-methyltransferase